MGSPSIGVFSVQSPKGMLEKLQREISRIATRSNNYEVVLDAAINGALTAWHLTDWVWKKRFAADAEARAGISIDCGDQKDPPNEFKDYVNKKCVHLALCQDVANGFKHMIAEHPDERQAPAAADTLVSAGAELIGGDGFLVFVGTSKFVPKIVDDEGDKHQAMDVLVSARDFWAEFLREHGID